jgi:hypothetical protein
MFTPEVQILEKIVRPLIVKHGLDPETDLGLIKRALLEQDGTVTIIHKMEPDQTRHRKTVGKLPGKE